MTAVSETRLRSVSRATSQISRSQERHEFRLSGDEYASLSSRASQAEHFEIQYGNSQSLIRVLSEELDMLRNSVSGLTGVISPGHSQHSMDKHIQGMQHRSINYVNEELRKVWSHEIQANGVLRNLILKTQRDSVDYAKSQSAKELHLREESRLLSHRLEDAIEETKHFKALIREKEQELSRMAGKSFHEQQVGQSSV